MPKTFYRLQMVRFDKETDHGFGGYQIPIAKERGDYLKANGEYVEFFGYASALNRATELNREINTYTIAGWKFVPVEKGYEQQGALL